MSIKDRIKMIMDREQLTAGAFAESIGVAQATISHILGPRNKYPSMEVILKLQHRYNDIDLNWLLTGQGTMLATSPTADGDAFDFESGAENAEFTGEDAVEDKNRKEMSVESTQNTSKEIVKQEIIYKERPARKITEIRIFFDDNTYETFKPEK